MSRTRLQFSPTPDMTSETTTGFPDGHPAHWEATRNGAVVGRYSFLLDYWEAYIPGREPHRCRTETAARLWLIRHTPDVPVVEPDLDSAPDGALFDAAVLTGQGTIDQAIATVEAEQTADVPDSAAGRWSATSTGDTGTVPFAQVRELLDAVEAVLDLPKDGAPDQLTYRYSFMSGVLSTVEDGRGADHAAVLLRKLANAAQGTEEVNR
ncbi:hypothetical protein ACWGKS_26930 [Nocardiopsis sp. NPDC055879]